MATKTTKIETAHPAVLLDNRGITIVGIASLLDWKDVVGVANDKFDPSVKGMNFDAIRFTVRGRLEFCVRKEDVVWAENEEVVDIEDVRGMPRCLDAFHNQDEDPFGLETKTLRAEAQDLSWSISFGETIRWKGLALRICEGSFIEWIGTRLWRYGEDDKPQFFPWFTLLQKELQNIVSGDFKLAGDEFAAEKKYIAIGLFKVVDTYRTWSYTPDLSLINALDYPESMQGLFKRRQKVANAKSPLYQNKGYEAFRNARAWMGKMEFKVPKNEDDLCTNDWVDYMLPHFSSRVKMIVFSDQPEDISTLTDRTPRDFLIMSVFDVYAHNVIAQIGYEGKEPELLKFPEGHPKDGCVYVRVSPEKDEYTELTKTNTGVLTLEEAEVILAKAKKALYKGK